MTECTYCGSRVDDHDPVRVLEGEDRTPAGAFCNYACLVASVTERDLTTGDACRWEPSG